MLLFKPPQASFRNSRHPSHPHHFQAQNRRQPSSTLDPPRDSGALLVPWPRAASPWRKAYSPTIGLSGAPIHLSVAQTEMKTSSESIAHGLDAYGVLGPTPTTTTASKFLILMIHPPAWPTFLEAARTSCLLACCITCCESTFCPSRPGPSSHSSSAALLL